jgi:hypothetical protein
MAALRTQVGITDGRTFLVSRKTSKEPGIGFESGWTAIKLPGMTQHHSSPPMHGLNQAANVHVHVAIPAQFADLFAILWQAQDCETALRVRDVRWADVQKSGSVPKRHYIIDMHGNADVFVEEFRGLFRSDARFGMTRDGYRRTKGKQKRNSLHINSLPENCLELTPNDGTCKKTAAQSRRSISVEITPSALQAALRSSLDCRSGF